MRGVRYIGWRTQLWRVLGPVNRTWKRWRTVEYHNNTIFKVPPPGSQGADDTAMIQATIDKAAEAIPEETQEFRDALSAYNAKWYRFFIRKPVFVYSRMVYFNKGIYTLKEPIVMGKQHSNMAIIGAHLQNGNVE